MSDNWSVTGEHGSPEARRSHRTHRRQTETKSDATRVKEHLPHDQVAVPKPFSSRRRSHDQATVPRHSSSTHHSQDQATVPRHSSSTRHSQDQTTVSKPSTSNRHSHGQGTVSKPSTSSRHSHDQATVSKPSASSHHSRAHDQRTAEPKATRTSQDHWPRQLTEERDKRHSTRRHASIDNSESTSTETRRGKDRSRRHSTRHHATTSVSESTSTDEEDHSSKRTKGKGKSSSKGTDSTSRRSAQPSGSPEQRDMPRTRSQSRGRMTSDAPYDESTMREESEETRPDSKVRVVEPPGDWRERAAVSTSHWANWQSESRTTYSRTLPAYHQQQVNGWAGQRPMNHMTGHQLQMPYRPRQQEPVYPPGHPWYIPPEETTTDCCCMIA